MLFMNCSRIPGSFREDHRPGSTGARGKRKQMLGGGARPRNPKTTKTRKSHLPPATWSTASPSTRARRPSRWTGRGRLGDSHAFLFPRSCWNLENDPNWRLFPINIWIGSHNNGGEALLSRGAHVHDLTSVTLDFRMITRIWVWSQRLHLNLCDLLISPSLSRPLQEWLLAHYNLDVASLVGLWFFVSLANKRPLPCLFLHLQHNKWSLRQPRTGLTSWCNRRSTNIILWIDLVKLRIWAVKYQMHQI